MHLVALPLVMSDDDDPPGVGQRGCNICNEPLIGGESFFPVSVAPSAVGFMQKMKRSHRAGPDCGSTGVARCGSNSEDRQNSNLRQGWWQARRLVKWQDLSPLTEAQVSRLIESENFAGQRRNLVGPVVLPDLGSFRGHAIARFGAFIEKPRTDYLALDRRQKEERDAIIAWRSVSDRADRLAAPRHPWCQ